MIGEITCRVDFEAVLNSLAVVWGGKMTHVHLKLSLDLLFLADHHRRTSYRLTAHMLFLILQVAQTIVIFFVSSIIVILVVLVEQERTT